MIIDTHQHVYWHGRNDAGLVADMDEQGVDLAWLLSWEIPADEDDGTYHGVLNPENVRGNGTHAGITLSDLLRTRDRYPDRFIVGYCPNPRLPNAPRLFASAVEIHDVRLCAEWKFRVPFDDPRCIELFRVAGQHKAPVVLHLDVPWRPDEDGKPVFQPQWYGGTVANLARALQACPDTIFIGHAPGFWREISGDADSASQMYADGPVTPGGRLFDLFDNHPNLYADLSAGSGLNALKRDADHAKQFILRYADRLLFGRDFYGGDLSAFLKTLDLPNDVTTKIYGGNAQHLVPIGSPS